MTRRLLPGLGIVLGCALLGAAPANAADTRFVAVGGLNSGTCTTVATACSYTRVLNGAGSVAGDTVIVRPGTYDVTAANVEINRKLDIRGEAGQPRPVFRDTNTGAAPFRVILAGADTSIQHIEIEATAARAFASSGKVALSDMEIRGANGCAEIQGPDSTVTGVRLVHAPSALPAGCIWVSNLAPRTRVSDVEVVLQHTSSSGPGLISSAAGVDVNNLRISGGGSGLYVAPDASDVGNRPRLRRVMISTGMSGATLGPGVVLTDSVVRTSGTNSHALDLNGAPVLRNVTAIATGSGSRGLSTPPMPGAAAEITARNLVLRGDGSDIHIDPDGTYTPFGPGNPICISLPEMCVPMPIYAAKLTLTNSNFRTVSGAALAPGSTANGAADPGFVDAAGGNFRAAPGSPLIDAGAADPENGATDLDGQARTQGSAPDIGAYETAGGAPPDPGGGAMVPPPPDPQTMPLDDAAPTLSALRIGNSRFRVGRQATPVAAGSTRRRAAAGTSFRFSSSEQATATVQIARGAAGRRRGRSCVKPTRRLRKAKKCTRYLPVGMLSRPAMAGANSVPFSGRIGSKALKPGPYMVAISARDIVGNPALRSLTGRFRIVRR